MSIVIPFFGTNVFTKPVVETKYVLIATDTLTGSAKALIKYDLDGNEIASATYTQVGATNNWKPRIIFSESDDEDYYYSCGDTTTARITKFNKDLTIATQSANISNSPEIIVAGKDMPIFTSATNGYSMRSKTDFSQTAIALSTTADRKVWYRITDIGVIPPRLAFITGADGMRVLTTTATVSAYVNTWSSNLNTYDSDALIYNRNTGEAIIGDTNGGSYLADILSSTRTGINNFTPTLRFTALFSNSDALYYDSVVEDIKRRTWNNLINDVNTDVWTISLADVVWLDIDTSDNFYVATSATTNNFRKYDSNGSLLWQKTSVASTANYGGGLAHK